jgi:RNA polymerase sigma-70 factor (ECF subfamily)
MIDNTNFIKHLKFKNPEAINYVLDTYGNLIYKISYMNLNSKELSEECVNDVLLKIWNSIEHFTHPDDKFKNWIAAIAKYTSIDLLRKEKKYFCNFNDENLSISSSDNVEKQVITVEEIKELVENLEYLKEIDKNIFIQRFFNNKSLKEIGELYNMTPNSVGLRIIRAREKLIHL